MSHGGPSYRPDIDGLRAVSVLAVFAFHADISRVPGGFVGVDVFFVISGYLISSIILGDLAAGRFSLARFYERRIRRILPALFLVLAVTALAAWWLLLPTRMAHFGGTLWAAVLSVSNVLFWMEAGYFDATLKAAPLLHTWSLGVEEQFYVVWPLLLMAVHAWRPRLVAAVMLAVVAASFALGAWQVAVAPGAAFYLLPGRAWELALGGLIALPGWRLPAAGAPAGRLLREAIAAAGLAMIAASCLLFTKDTVFPGPAAALPCLGAALVILAGKAAPGQGAATLTGRLLGLGPVVWIGRISYSLYLWHWPLIVFKQTAGISLSPSGMVDKLAVIGIGIVLAWLSWRFVEQPFRQGPLLPHRAAAFRFAGAGAALATAAGLWLGLSGGVPGRFPPAVVATAAHLAAGADNGAGDGSDCFVRLGADAAALPAPCLQPEPGRPNVLLFGDSHGAHLRHGLLQAFPNVRLLVATGSGCRPLIGGGTPPDSPRCAEMKARMFTEVLPRLRLDRVVLAAAWKPQEEALLRQTLAALEGMGQQVTVVGPIVMYGGPLPELLAMGMLRGDPGFAARRRLDDQRLLDLRLRDLLAGRPVRYVSLQALLCGDGTCLERAEDGTPLQFDYGHLTPAGSVTVARLLAREGVLP